MINNGNNEWHLLGNGFQRFLHRPFLRTMVTLGLIIALAASLFPPIASRSMSNAATTPIGDQEYELLISRLPNHKDALSLDDQYIVSGDIFIFLSETTGVQQVRYYLDPPATLLDDPAVGGTPRHTANKAPFEFNNKGSKSKKPGVDTTRITNGIHTITAAIDLNDGQTQVIHTPFEVQNGAPRLVIRPGKLSFGLAAGESTTRQLDILTSDGSEAEFTLSADVPWITFDGADAAFAPDTHTITINSDGLAPGSYKAQLTATAEQFQSATIPVRLRVTNIANSSPSGATAESQRALAAVNELVMAMTVCSPLPCAEILIDLPYILGFDQDHGKIQDGNGNGTGFTYISQPTTGTGYIPANLQVDTSGQGTISITTTNGIMAGSANTQDNALAVGIDAPNQVSVLSTTLVNPPYGAARSEQGGLWFGNDEDNYVKLEVISTGKGPRIEYLMEVNGSTVTSKTNSPSDLSNSTIVLTLRADPTDQSISATYQIDNGPEVDFKTAIAPPEFFSFDAAGIDPTIGTRSFGGIFATHRKASAPLTYVFDQFSVTDQELPPPTSGGPTLEFDRSSFPIPMPTSMAWGPDNRLYVTELFGKIHAITLNDNKEFVSDQVITTLGSRLTLGIAVDPASTPGNVILWVAHSNPSANVGELNSSTVSRLSGPGFTIKDDIITGLPRAIANHAINSIHFGPDGRLYIAHGGNTGAGAANSDNTEFGNRAEQPLSAAFLVADVKAAGFDGSCATPENTYGPSPCDVQVYSSGLRNMYDFVIHSNGHIYGPDNGLGVKGSFPPSPTAPCEGFGSTVSWKSGGHNPGEQPDNLLLLQSGKYYGHPNPYRNECVFKDGSYQGVTAPSNYTLPLFNLGKNKSANGIIEYKANSFDGALAGEMLITNYSVGDDITRIKLASDGLSVLSSRQLASGFNDPLPIVEGPDGEIYVGEFGASKITVLIPKAVASNPNGTWTTKQPHPVDRLDVGGTALDGNLYIVAGKIAGSGPQRTMYVYNPTQDTWTQAPSMPTAYAAVENPSVVAYNGKLYVFGGSSDPFSGAVASAAVFDPATQGWTMLASMSTPRGGATAQAIGSLIYVVGGMDGSGGSLTSVEVYNPATNSWTSAASMGTPRDNPGSAALDGKLYVFGGRHRSSTSGEINGTLATVEMYDPATNTWNPRASMPTGRRTMVVGTLNGRAQVMGGERRSDGNTFPENEEYDPLTDTWRTLTPMLTPRHGAAAGTINGVVYVVAGGPTAGAFFSNINEAFSFDNIGDTTAPAAPANLTATASADTTKILLDWNDNGESDLNGYNVYRATQVSGPFTKINAGTIGSSSYDDTSAPSGITLYYRVTAVDTSTNESAPSNTASALRPADTTSPAAPTGLSATGSTSSIVLDWNDNAETDLSGYHVYRGTSVTGPFTKLTPSTISGSAYDDTTASTGTTFYYRVTAVDTSSNESAPSDTASATRIADTVAPAVPTGLAATGTTAGISLDWADNTETDLAGYNVYRSDSDGGSYTKLNSSLSSGSAYTDSSTTVGIPYYYKVTAVDATGNESAQSASVNASRLASTNVINRSLSPDRANPSALSGLTVSGNIYVFLSVSSTSGISRISFYLDDPSMSGTPRRIETSAPYDFAGGSTNAANAFNTTAVGNGTHVITAAIQFSGGSTEVVEATFTIDNSGGEPPTASISLPGRFEAEDYNAGGEGLGYHDTTAGNSGGACRNDNVDKQLTSDVDGNCNIGWVRIGEWLQYTVSVASDGVYDLTLRAATPYNSKKAHVEIDGTNVTGTMAIPNTGSWQTWTNVTATGINLTAGVHTLRIVMDSSDFNLNYVTVTAVAP